MFLFLLFLKRLFIILLAGNQVDLLSVKQTRRKSSYLER